MRWFVNGSVGSKRPALLAALAVVGSMALGGCLEKGFLDQTELGAFNQEPLVVPVLRKLNTGVEEPVELFGQAEEPTAADLVPPDGDYPIMSGDLVAITISDLRGPGLDDGKQVRVTDSGRVSLPFVGQVNVAGMTEAQAEEAISRAYRDANIIANTQVTVTVIEARGRTFSILGAVGRAGQYQIYKNDFRLLDAFVASADFDVTRGTRGYEFVFVIRKRTPGQSMSPSDLPFPTTPPAEDLRPRSQVPGAGDLTQATYLQATEPTAPAAAPNEPTGEGRYVIIDGKPVLVGGSQPAPEGTPVAPAPMAEPTPAADPAPAVVTPAPAPATPGTFEFNAPTEPSDTRVIRIPMTRLAQGELRFNVVILPGDLIFVPNPLEGVYYMGGHVQRTGAYQLGNGNRVSLMDAIIAAGGLDQVAVPWRTQIIRRLQGQDQQVFATVDLTKIFNGEEPDIFMRRDDKVIVGTQWWAPFLAALRNGFRITYGFGFLYDRNFYDDDNNNN